MQHPKQRRKRLPRKRHPSPGVAVTTSTFRDAVSRARWLFDFLRLELDSIQIAEWRRVRRCASGFVDDGNSVVETDKDVEVVRNSADPLEMLPTPEILRRLQAEVRRGIQHVLDGHWWDVEGPKSSGIARWDQLVRKGHRVGGFRALFLTIAQDTVKDYWPEIRACPWCHHWFLRNGKQAFCSPACSRKIRWKRFAPRRRQRNYRAERERALRKRLGGRVKVGRKARR